MESSVNSASTGFALWSFHACQPACSLLSSAFSTVAFICENNGTPDNSRAKPSAVKAIRRILLLQSYVVTRTIDRAKNRVNHCEGFPKPSRSVFEPHALSCVESLTFIRDGIVWYRSMIDAQAIRSRRSGLRRANQPALPALEEVMEDLAELMQRLLEIQSGGRQRSPELIADDERLMDGLRKRYLAGKPPQENASQQSLR